MSMCYYFEGRENIKPKSAAEARKLIGKDVEIVAIPITNDWQAVRLARKTQSEMKHRLGKLPGAAEVAEDVPACLASQGFTALDITVAHAQRAGSLPGPHRDPFDRMLIAQAQADHLPVISIEEVFDARITGGRVI